MKLIIVPLFAGLVGATGWFFQIVMVPLFGQATEVQQIPWGLGGTYGMLGILAWYLWYNQTKTLPNMQEAHRKDMTETHLRYERVQDSRDEELRESRKIFSEQSEGHIEAMNSLTTEIQGFNFLSTGNTEPANKS